MRGALLVAAIAFAAIPARASADEDAPTVTVERNARGERVYRVRDAVVVPGEVQRPHAYYVLQRLRVEFAPEPLEQTFLPRILQATGKHPF